ncbi:MAG TPA: DUF3870 domain-containing protein [Amycolatopsis sp.]|uniref:DUF3870 domain-containing protein n=1 Tax=Amycolatopsis nalaikhensis TaxID=715472 RepID=A0ABY8XK02_9PSEU|nr:DUF3870 domain-containing protein [Amycolatopsis sp. 2-2]WIV55964.1 DUF3870 domain-containing protein [Amycolatopsis sp. 2-2]
MGRRASLIVVGYAKVPKTSAAHGVHEFLSVSLRIDRETGAVVEVDSTAISAMVRTWVSELLLGVDFTADITPVLAEIDANYLSNATGSLKQAIHDAWRRYASHRAH